MRARVARTSRTTLWGELSELWRSLKTPFSGYRPERHYMRGPGPKWREKHARSQAPEVAGALPRPV